MASMASLSVSKVHFPNISELTRIPLLTTLPLIARYLRQAHPLSITGVFDVNVEQLQIVKSTR